jgi:adenylate kinase
VNIILFGPPGAGKGTQSDHIAKNFNLYKVSSGDLLRQEVKNKTPLSKEIKSLLDKGSLVSDETIDTIVEKILLDNTINNRLIFDGYPRNINQAKKLDSLTKNLGIKISCVLCLEVDKDTIVKRILGRQICSKCSLIFNKYFNPSNAENHPCGEKFLLKRTDDNEDTASDRFETYLNKTLPIIDFYKKQNIHHQINGMAKIDEIFKEIRGIIASLEG